MENFSASIAEVYDAVLDPTLWPRALKKAARFVGGSSAVLFSKNTFDKSGNLVFAVGLDEQFKALYSERYITFDPIPFGAHFQEIGEPIAATDLVPYNEFLQSRFYHEWARPQQLVDSIAVVLDKSPATAAVFEIFRHESDGIADEGARARMRLIIPHFRRAVVASMLIKSKTDEAANFRNALDGLKPSVFLVDANGRIEYANAAGHALLYDGDVLRAASGRIIATDLDTQKALYDVLAALQRGDAKLEAKGIVFPLGRQRGESYFAHALSLASDARRREGSGIAAAIFVHKEGIGIQQPLEVISEQYRLTPAELRVLLAVMEVDGTPQIAETLGIGAETVKTHLKRIYAKTGTCRQTDLIKLVAASSNLLVP
jgi:DNA-binding CsgD family transcriptional regulator